MASRDGVKRKRVHLNVAQKLDLIEKLEQGFSVAHVCEIYGVKKQTVSDIRKSKNKLQEFSSKYSAVSFKFDSPVTSRKHMKVAKEKNLEEAVYRWYVEQRSSGVNVRSLELKSVRETLGKHMGLNVKASNGWLWRFRKRHGIDNEKTYGQSLRADTSLVENNPGYQVLTEEEIVDKILAGNVKEEKNVEEEQVIPARPTISEMKNLMEVAIHYIRTSSDPEIISYYEYFQQFKAILIKKQYDSDQQVKPEAFFNPPSPTLVPISSPIACMSEALRSKQTTPMLPFMKVSEHSESKYSSSPLPSASFS